MMKLLVRTAQLALLLVFGFTNTAVSQDVADSVAPEMASGLTQKKLVTSSQLHDQQCQSTCQRGRKLGH